MGQRLVVTIERDKKKLCNIYFHWSAYTVSALWETQKIVNCIYNHKDETEKEMLLRLIRFCENNGGGISGGRDGDEWKYIQNLYPNETFKAECINRNDGLISLSEKEMQESQYWSEGDVIIDLDEDLINFGVYAGYDSLDGYLDERREWDDEFEGLTLEEIPDIGYDLGYIDVEYIDAVVAAVDAANSNPVRCGNEIFELTE